jgi:hypothetical protein
MRRRQNRSALSVATLLAVLVGSNGTVALSAEPVTLDTFVRAETDTAMRVMQDRVGVGAFEHSRQPTSLDDQPVIRMNRDTLYSGAVLDLSSPATVTLPETGGRYMGLLVINQDHYMRVYSGAGDHKLTQDENGTRYAYLIVRTFVDAGNPEDIAVANSLQDKVQVKGGGSELEIPDWDQSQLKALREALNALAAFGMDTSRAFGSEDSVEPIHYLVGAASGWGGNPPQEATGNLRYVEKDDGTPYVLNVGEVPVDGFWSVTVYNKQGYMEPNDLDAYSFNNVTAKPNEDGSFTIHFGACDDGRVNCLPIQPGWNYTVRLYRPRDEILNGTFTFPGAEPVQ